MNAKPVDLEAVRGSRARLVALARAHPELAGSRGPENCAAWEATLAAMEEVMPEETQQVGFRMPIALVEKVDAYAARMNVEHPGMSYTRADAARVLITRRLIAVGMLDAAKADAGGVKTEPKAKPQKGGNAPRKAK